MPLHLPRPWFIAVGASGSEGLNDIKALLVALGPLSNAIMMVVLHRPFDKPSYLREVLQTATRSPVLVAEQGLKLEVGCCYIGEPAAHLTLLAASFAGITGDPLKLERNRTVDLLFNSVAAQAGVQGIGVVLSGNLDDGSRGIAAINAAGGQTMVILRAARPAGMPENAINYDGPIDVIGSAEEIGHTIVGLTLG